MNRRLLLAPLCCLPLAFAACGGDGASGTLNSAQTIAAQTQAAGGANVTPNPQTEPMLQSPVNRYTVTLDDTGITFLTDPASPFALTLDGFAATEKFKDRQTGKDLLTQWGYIEGYEADLVPEGRENAVLNGAVYVTLESHLFSSIEGAKQAYNYFDIAMKAAPTNKQANLIAIGSQSVAYVALGEKVAQSSIDSTYHRVLFRRGNLVVLVSTYGAEGFANLDYPTALAQLIDRRALGSEPVIEPTPPSNYTPPPNSGTVAPRITPGQTPVETSTPVRTATRAN